MTTFMQDAAANWPEDEANATARQFTVLIHECGETQDYALAWLKKDRQHMHEVFNDFDFCARFDAELTKQLPNIDIKAL